MGRTQVRWEVDSRGISHGHVVDSETPDSTGPCPVCGRRHRADLIQRTNMNTACFKQWSRLQQQAGQRQ